jgi:DNA primase
MSYEIDLICKKHKIIDFLKQRGHMHVSFDGSRYKYHCPLPSHKNDKTPSFYVFEKNDREDYFCFGCKSAGSVIHLLSAYENISFRDSLKKLSEGLNIKIDDVMDSLLKEILIYTEKNEDNKNEEIVAVSLYISNLVYKYLQKVNFHQEHLQIAEKIYKLTDNLIYTENLKDLEKLSQQLASKTRIKYEEFLKKTNDERIKFLKSSLQKTEEII